MKLYVGSDHAGFKLKEYLLTHFPKANYKIEFIDCGTKSEQSVDYPDFANEVCQKMKTDKNSLGILICGSGQGMAIRANRFSHIRAALCWNHDITKLSRQHNNANILCMGARSLSPKLALELTQLFVSTPFEEGRHLARVKKLSEGC